MFAVVFVLGLLYHTYTDLKYMLLYDNVTLFLAAVGILRTFYEDQSADAVYGAGVMLAIMLLLYFASRGGMGEGDVKLAPALGIWLGLEQGLLCLLQLTSLHRRQQKLFRIQLCCCRQQQYRRSFLHLTFQEHCS